MSSFLRAYALVAILLSAAFLPKANAQLFWDTNNTTVYSGNLGGIWGTDNFWSTDANGLAATTGYTPGSQVTFAAGIDGLSTYTVTLGSNQTASGINFQEGHITINPVSAALNETLTLNGTSPTLNVQNMDSTIKARISAATAPLTKTGVGKLTIDFGNSTSSSYFNFGTQTVTINGGTLQLAGTTGTSGNNQLSNTAFRLIVNSGSTFHWGNITNSVSDSAVFTINTGGTVYSTAGDQIRNINGTGLLLLVGGTLNFAASGTETFSGLITGTASIGLTSAGGTLNLTNANPFSGNTTASIAGTGTQGIVLAHARALQNSTLTMTRGTTAGTSIRFANGIGTFITGALSASSDITSTNINGLLLQDISGAGITLQTGNNDSTTSYSGVLTGLGGLTKIGTGTLTLNGHFNSSTTAYTANTYSGDTTVNAGSHNSNTGGPVSSTTAGTLKLGFDTAGSPTSNIINPASRLVLGGGRLLLTGKTTVGNSASQTFNNTKLNAGRSYVTVTTTTGANAVLNLGTIDRSNNPGSILEFTLPSGTQSLTNGITTTTANDASGILGGWAVIGNEWAVKDTAGTAIGNVIAAPTSVYTTYTNGDISSSTTSNLLINNTATSITTAAGATDLNTIIARNNSSDNATVNRTLDIASTETLRTDAIWNQGTGTLTIGTASNVGTLTASTGESELIINNAGGEIFINSTITNNSTGPVTLVKTGPTNQLTLTGTNTYTGGTIVNQGRLRVSNNAAIGSGAVTVMPGGQAWLNSNQVYSNEFIISGTGWGEGTAGVGPGAIRLANGATLGKTDGTSNLTLAGDARIGGNSTTATIAAKITGDYALDLASGGSAGGGASTFTINNTANDFTGNLTLNSVTGTGTGITSYSAFNASPVTVKLGASEVIPNGLNKGNVILSGGAAGSLVTLDLNGFNETINSLISYGTHANTAITNNGAASTTSTLTIGDNHTSTLVTTASSVTTFFGGIIKDGTGLIGLTKIGEGTQTLTGANTYSGATTINKGILQAGAVNTFSANSAVTLANDPTTILALTDGINDFSQTIQSLSGFGTVNLGTIAAADATKLTTGSTANTTYAGLIVGGGGLIKQGTGRFTLTGNNTYVGSTAVNLGNLQVGDLGLGQSGSGATSVANNATLSGTGTVRGATIILGTIKPGDNGGDSVGKLTFSDLTASALTLTTGGTAATPRAIFTLAGATGNEANPLDGIQTTSLLNGTFGNHDALDIQGTLNLTSGSLIKVDLATGYSPTLGDVFNLIDWGTVNGTILPGTFNPATDLLLETSPTMTANGWSWQTDQFLTSGIIYVTNAVPEPTRPLLLILGLTLATLRRRRRI